MKHVSVTAVAMVVMLLLALETITSVTALSGEPRFRVIVLAEGGAQHGPFVEAAKGWLTQLARDSSFTVEYIHTPDSITTDFLARYRLFIQLDYPPYGWKDTARAAFERYLTDGTGGGWVGFHHATLLGEFDGYPMWQWFSAFMGGIRWQDYIPAFAEGTVRVEDTNHPIMRGLPASFVVEKEEWYTYDRSPRAGVHVLASVSESSYVPSSSIRMGDHPVVWTNEHVKARNIYMFMGHHPDLFDDQAFTSLFRNAIFWVTSQ